MTIHLRAHFDGRVLVPEQPVDLPLNQTFEVEVSSRGANGAVAISNGSPINGVANSEHAPTPEVIRERLRKLEALNGLLPGPVIPLESLRRENLYDDRA